MAYFNNAFCKTFVVGDADLAAGTATSALGAGVIGLVDGADWETVLVAGGGAVPAITAGELGYLVQGSFYTKDTIGNNPGHGGYKESVKSKGMNPRYITRLWAANSLKAEHATAKLCLASDCAPCGKTQFMRLDVKGSPALRFLNHNAYAIADSANVCCVDGQEYIDPALILGVMAQMALADPLIKPFVAEGSVNGLGDPASGQTLVKGAGYSTGVAATTAVDRDSNPVSASTRSGFEDAKIDVTAVDGSGGIDTYTVAQAGAGYEDGDVLTVAGGSTDATITLAADGLTVGSVIVTKTDANGVELDEYDLEGVDFGKCLVE